MDHQSQAGASSDRNVSLLARLAAAAGYALAAFIGLSILIWLMREMFQYSEFEVLFGTAYLERQQALGSAVAPLAIIPWAINYFGEIPLHVLTGVLMAWKNLLVMLSAVFGFWAAGLPPTNAPNS